MPRRPSFSSPRRQHGVALIVVLLILLVVTLLGLASMRGSILQERMAGATISRSKAFQAAEATLRQAEAIAASERPVPPSSGCSTGARKGVCARTAPGSTPVWRSDAFWSNANNYSTATTMAGTESKFVLEDYGLAVSPDCAAAAGANPFDMSAPACSGEIRVYRIIARSQTDSGAVVMLQSLFRAP